MRIMGFIKLRTIILGISHVLQVNSILTSCLSPFWANSIKRRDITHACFSDMKSLWRTCTWSSKNSVNHNTTETDIWYKAFTLVCWGFSSEIFNVNRKSTNKGIHRVLFLLWWHLLVPERLYCNTKDRCFIMLYDMVYIHLYVSTQTYTFKKFLVHFIRKRCQKNYFFLVFFPSEKYLRAEKHGQNFIKLGTCWICRRTECRRTECRKTKALRTIQATSRS